MSSSFFSSLRHRFSESASIAGSEIAPVAGDGREEVVEEEKLYVAVGRKVSESKSTLLWALQKNSGGKGIMLLHVNQPSQTISVLGGTFPVSLLGEREVKAHRENERQAMNKILDEYVQAEKLYIDMDSIEKGIVELISRHRIGNLVMGGAADGRYSRKMIEPKSKKASYVRQQAPAFCHIWFICKQRLIHTREGVKGTSLNNEDGPSSSSRSNSVSTSENNSSMPGLYRGSDAHRDSRGMDFEANGMVMLSPSPSTISMFSTPESVLDAGSSIDFDQSSVISVSQLSTISANSESVTGSPFSSLSRIGEQEADFSFSSLPPNGRRNSGPSAPNALESGMHEKLYQQLVQAMEEAEIARRQGFEELMRHRKAEKDTIQALRRAKASESLYLEEVRRSKELVEELAKRTEELEEMKHQRDMALEELEITRDEKMLLESQVERSVHLSLN
ncbi:U-box domain-containing protein [Drosera capensis]